MSTMSKYSGLRYSGLIAAFAFGLGVSVPLSAVAQSTADAGSTATAGSASTPAAASSPAADGTGAAATAQENAASSKASEAGASSAGAGAPADTGNEAAASEQTSPPPAAHPNSLQGRVEQALARKNLSTSVGVHVKTFGPVVKLYGTVASGVISDKANYVAGQVSGVAEVSNDLKVRGQ